MEMVKHTIELLGESVEGGRPSPGTVGEVLRLVEPTVRMSVSMGFRNTSQKLGRPPKWFQQATDVRFTGMSRSPHGGTSLRFEAPRFREAAADIYSQGELFNTRPEETDTGFDLLGDVVVDVRESRRDSCRYDRALLNKMHRLYRAARKMGVESIALFGDRLPSDSPISIDEAVSKHAARMQQITPPDQRARIAGKLDMIRDSDSVFEVMLGDNTTVRGIWTPGDMEPLRSLFRTEVLIEGTAVYRPSGGLLRLEAEAIRVASGGDDLFRKIPAPLARSTSPQTVRQRQTPTSGANAIFGRWPGDETEEELLAACEDTE